MTFRQRLVHELTELDRREVREETRRRIPSNPYRLAHYLRAADDVIEDVMNGDSEAGAFARRFVPTRGMHTVARHLGLPLDVQRGKWVVR